MLKREQYWMGGTATTNLVCYYMHCKILLHRGYDSCVTLDIGSNMLKGAETGIHETLDCSSLSSVRLAVSFAQGQMIERLPDSCQLNRANQRLHRPIR